MSNISPFIAPFLGSPVVDANPDVVLCDGLQDAPNETKIQLTLAAVAVRSSVFDMQKSASVICHSIYTIRQLAPDHWETFCTENFGFGEATARRYCSVGEMLHNQIGSNGIALEDFSKLSAKALKVLSAAPDASVIAFIGDAKRTPLAAVDSASVATKLVEYATTTHGNAAKDLAIALRELEDLRADKRASEDAKAQANETIQALTEQLQTSEDELVKSKGAAARAQQHPTVVQVVESPLAPTQEMKRRLKDQESEIAANNTKLAQQQAAIAKAAENTKRLDVSYRRSEDIAEVVTAMTRDIGDLLVKYPRELINKLIAADARVTSQLMTLSQSAASFSTQIRP